MVDEIHEAREAVLTDVDAHFFAHLEILGLKNAKRQGIYDSLKEKIDRFVETSKEDIEKEKAESKDEFGFGIDFGIGLGSICIWTQNDYRLYQFDNLLQIVGTLLVNGFKQGIPLRGVIGYGDFKVEQQGKTDEVQDVSSFDNKELHGMVLNEAHDFVEQMNWSGVVLTRNAWEEVERVFKKGADDGWGRVMRPVKIDSVKYLLGRYLLPYDIPFEDGGCKKYNAVNWNYNPNKGLSKDVIQKAFEGPCAIYDCDIKSKRNKTLQFFEHSQRAAKARNYSGLENFLII